MVEWSCRQRWFNSRIASQADAERTASVMRAVLATEIIPRAAKQAEIVSRSCPVRRKNRTMGADRHPFASGHS